MDPIETLTPCGRRGCIVLYKGEYCLFCVAAREILESKMAQFDVPDSAVCFVDIDKELESGVTALPTIRICDITMTGLPDEDAVGDAVLRVLMRECFCE